nr:ribonuclease H-like domain-containing protein [Tanacetum cinerariifolium]
MLEEMARISSDSVLVKWHRISKGLMHGRVVGFKVLRMRVCKVVEIRMGWLLFQGLQTRVELVMLLLLGLRVLELGIKPCATTTEDWVILLGTAQPGQGEGMLLIFRLSDLDEIEEVNANCILMANLQQASTSGTRHDKAPVYDTDSSAEVHLNDNWYDNEIFNMFTQEEQYTDLLEPIPEPQLVPQNDNHVTYVAPSIWCIVGVQ